MKRRSITILMASMFIIFIMISVNSCSPKNENKGKLVIPTKDFLTDHISDNPFGDEWVIRENMQVYSDLETRQIITGVFQKKKQLRIIFNLVDNQVSGSKKVSCIISFNPMYFFVAGIPVLFNSHTEKKKDIDYLFKNERLFFKVTAEDHFKYIELNVVSRKLKNLGDLTIEDKMKQARMIRRIRQKTDSWSPLTPDQIIAQPTLRPIISHGGYAADGTKKAVIWANNTKLTGTFELLDALNNRQHPDPQPVVYTGILKETGSHIWGGNNYIADFSDFRQEGLYFLRLKVNETNEVTDSYV
ncbi:MAG: hypothetical protein KAT38_10480, partial [Bacteroidales bacterium]|nr:hypothetical protein [Bacteroidales bacterium]